MNRLSLRFQQWLGILKFAIFSMVFIGMLYWNNLRKTQVHLTISTDHPQRNSSKLLDFENFRFLTNNTVCENVSIVIIIHSAPEHFANRDVIRQTWGSALPGIKPVFMLALPSNETVNKLLHQESIRHKDIVQGNFVDTYKNLTYKHVMGLKWASENCPDAEHIIKMDDDIFVEIYQLVNLLRNQFLKLEKQIVCIIMHNTPVIRDPVSKWFVSEKEYSGQIYENYCSGWAYVVNPKTAKTLSEKANALPYFWIDDVYVTGTVAAAAGIKRIAMNNYLTIETETLARWMTSKSNLLWNKMFAPSWGDLDLMKSAHLAAKWCHSIKCVCCYSPEKPSIPEIESLPPPTGRSLIKRLS